MPAVTTDELPPALLSRVVEALHGQQLHYADKRELQASNVPALQRAGLPVQREVRLSARERIDALVGRIGIDAKVAAEPRTLERQLTRYAHYRWLRRHADYQRGYRERRRVAA